MCEANAYIYEDGEERLYLENVDILKPEGDMIYMRNLFGEQKEIRARIKEISLLSHKIVLERMEE